MVFFKCRALSKFLKLITYAELEDDIFTSLQVLPLVCWAASVTAVRALVCPWL